MLHLTTFHLAMPLSTFFASTTLTSPRIAFRLSLSLSLSLCISPPLPSSYFTSPLHLFSPMLVTPPIQLRSLAPPNIKCIPPWPLLMHARPSIKPYSACSYSSPSPPEPPHPLWSYTAAYGRSQSCVCPRKHAWDGYWVSNEAFQCRASVSGEVGHFFFLPPDVIYVVFDWGKKGSRFRWK